MGLRAVTAIMMRKLVMAISPSRNCNAAQSFAHRSPPGLGTDQWDTTTGDKDTDMGWGPGQCGWEAGRGGGPSGLAPLGLFGSNDAP